MDREELDELMSIGLETRRDVESILFALEQVPDGYSTTTYLGANEELGRPGEIDESYLFDLHTAIMLLSEAHDLKLDMSRHRCKLEGLLYNLGYNVWHRKDAAANGMFDDEASPKNRDCAIDMTRLFRAPSPASFQKRSQPLSSLQSSSSTMRMYQPSMPKSLTCTADSELMNYRSSCTSNFIPAGVAFVVS